jgi:hypothetical protein
MDNVRRNFPPPDVLRLPESENWSTIPVVVQGAGIFVGNGVEFRHEFNPNFAGNRLLLTPIYPDQEKGISIRDLKGCYPLAQTYDPKCTPTYVCVASYESNKSTSHSKYYVNLLEENVHFCGRRIIVRTCSRKRKCGLYIIYGDQETINECF